MTTKTITDGLFKPELWAKELNRKINEAGVMLDCVNRKYEGIIKNQGDTVNIQTVGNVTVSSYAADTNLTYQKLDGETQKLTIDQKKYFGFVVDDIEKVQANIEYMSKYLDQAKKELVNVQDTFLLGKAADVPANNQLGDITLTSDNAYSVFVTLRTKLARSGGIDSNGKGADGKNPWAVVTPEIMGVLLQAPQAVHATALGDNTIRKGSLIRIAGFDVKESTNLKEVTVGSGESAVTSTTVLAGTTEAISFAEQIVKVETLKDKDSFGDFVRGLYVYGAKTIQPAALASAVIKLA